MKSQFLNTTNSVKSNRLRPSIFNSQNSQKEKSNGKQERDQTETVTQISTPTTFTETTQTPLLFPTPVKTDFSSTHVEQIPPPYEEALETHTQTQNDETEPQENLVKTSDEFDVHTPIPQTPQPPPYEEDIISDESQDPNQEPDEKEIEQQRLALVVSEQAKRIENLQFQLLRSQNTQRIQRIRHEEELEKSSQNSFHLSQMIENETTARYLQQIEALEKTVENLRSQLHETNQQTLEQFETYQQDFGNNLTSDESNQLTELLQIMNQTLKEEIKDKHEIVQNLLQVVDENDLVVDN